MSAIVVRDLFRVHAAPEGAAVALQGLSLEVAEGETVVVLGPSGAGKTTLLRTIAGLETPSAGSVHVFGSDVTRLSHRARSRFRANAIGYVAQHYDLALAPELTARELVALGLRLRGESRRRRDARADELLERVELLDRRSARPAELSGGEQQRVAVCAALAPRPRLLLADEPTGELDADAAALVYRAIADLARAEGTTTLVVSHDAASTRIADRVVEIRDGRVSDEARPGSRNGRAIVVGRGGWARLPEELLLAAGIGAYAHAAADGGRLVLTPVPARRGTGPRDVPAPSRGRRTGAEASLRAVTKTYGRGAAAVSPLVGVTASFAAGRFHVVTGPSGSGKTTLLQLLAGLELPTAGDVVVAGRAISTLSRGERAALRARDVGVVARLTALNPLLSALENVELAQAIAGGRESRSEAVRTLTALGLAERLHQRVSRLSAGERARVALARAVARRPRILVADEPTALLDEAHARVVARLLRGLADDGLTVVCATHDRVVVEQADDELALGRRDR